MVIVQGLIAMASRQLSKLLNTAFGWATMLLFGKVPQDKQLTLSVISLGSVLWLIVVIGIAVPRVGVFLLSFVTLPRWVDDGWIRVAMLVAAIVIPLIVGLLSKRVAAASTGGSRTQGAAGILYGYPITLGLALTLIMLTVFAPLIKFRQTLRRWTATHVPVIVKSQDYLTVVGRIEKALADEGIATRREQASALIRVPTKLLTALAGRAFATLVADQLTVLKGEDLEVMLHPADMVISGKERSVVQARIVIAERLVFSEANQTWTKEATEIEDALTALWQAMRINGMQFSTTVAPSRLKALREELHQTPLPFEEWEVLARGIARIDEAILGLAAGVIH